MVAALVAVLLTVFFVLRLHTAGAPQPPVTAAGEVPSLVDADAGRSVAVGKDTISSRAAPPDPKGIPATADGERAAESEAQGDAADPAAGPTWSFRSPGDFTEQELADCGTGVTVDLGRYHARRGEPFDVGIALTSPALESCTIVLDYDTEALAVVPGSAEPRGRLFRGGIECYADEQSGRLVLIHAGVPGKKNLDGSAGDCLGAVWRMRPLRRGTTRLSLAESTEFTNGQGSAEPYRVTGGTVTVR